MKRDPGSMRSWLAPSAVAVLALTIVGLLAFSLGHRLATPSSQLVAQLPTATSPTPIPASLTDVARNVMSRTVTIEVERANDEKLGTGWLFDTKGDFVTNAHVITGQLGIRVRDRAGNTYDATVLGEDDTADVAVIRCTHGFVGDPLPTTTTSPATGAPVVAIASARATGHADVTLETVAGLGVDVPVKDNPNIDPSQAGASTVYKDMVAVSGAKVFPGNSGGPVLNNDGQVFGIVTLASTTGNRGYVIPLDRVFAQISSYVAAG